MRYSSQLCAPYKIGVLVVRKWVTLDFPLFHKLSFPNQIHQCKQAKIIRCQVWLEVRVIKQLSSDLLYICSGVRTRVVRKKAIILRQQWLVFYINPFRILQYVSVDIFIPGFMNSVNYSSQNTVTISFCWTRFHFTSSICPSLVAIFTCYLPFKVFFPS